MQEWLLQGKEIIKKHDYIPTQACCKITDFIIKDKLCLLHWGHLFAIEHAIEGPCNETFVISERCEANRLSRLRKKSSMAAVFVIKAVSVRYKKLTGKIEVGITASCGRAGYGTSYVLSPECHDEALQCGVCSGTKA